MWLQLASGAAASWFSLPFDFVKTRMQKQVCAAPLVEHMAVSTGSRVCDVMRASPTSADSLANRVGWM